MFKLPELAYNYNALEPFIDTLTMETHHSKHHQTYVTNLNNALSKYPEFLEKKIEDILTNLDSLPQDVRQAVINNGGGHYNHSLFWELMSPQAKPEPTGELKDKINQKFGSLDSFKDAFKTAALGRFGSGWAWLTLDANKELGIVATLNQDSPISDGHSILLGLDVWEHAYYLNYQNRRAEYIDAWWKVLNWDQVEANYERFK